MSYHISTLDYFKLLIYFFTALILVNRKERVLFSLIPIIIGILIFGGETRLNMFLFLLIFFSVNREISELSLICNHDVLLFFQKYWSFC